MTIIKALWSSVQADPTLMRRLNGWLTIFWIVMIPVSIMLGLLASVTDDLATRIADLQKRLESNPTR